MTEVKRVLHVVHYPVFGGPHNQTLRLASRLREHGIETVMAIPDEPGSAGDRLRAGGVEVRQIPLSRLRSTKSIRTHAHYLRGFTSDVRGIRSLIRSEHIDIVQLSGLINPQAAFAARAERIPLVWQLLDSYLQGVRALPWMVLVRSMADVVMSTGLRIAEMHPLAASLGSRLVPFFPPVDTSLFYPSGKARRTTREEWHIPESRFVVGCVSNINPQKGILQLVDAFGLMRESGVDAVLVLAGSEYEHHSGYSRSVRDEIKKHSLVEGEDVLFLGGIDRTEQVLNGFDVFAFSPALHGEGVSTVVLEAMASGLPVVVSDVGAIREAVGSAGAAAIVPPGNTEAFASELCRLAYDRSARAAMGSTARQRAENAFSIAACSRTHLTAYQIASRHRSGAAG